MGIRLDNYRHRVNIQQAVETIDSNGQTVITYDTIATVWASVIPIRSSEVFQLDQTKDVDSFEVKVRYRNDITKRHRLLWKNRVLNIGSLIDDDNNKEEIIMECTSIG